MKLVVRDIRDKELLFKMIHEKGALFYRYIEETGEYEILYHSIDKTVHYIGKIDQKELETKIFPFGYKVAEIIFDETTGEIKIKQ
ncbi:MAG: hypothetical protein QW270_06670 [Candidatus Bathyarchaeia archaeon]